MIKKYTLDKLNENSVSVKIQQFTEVDKVEYLIGQPYRKSYLNSTRGRQEVKNELPNQQQNAIFAVWGDAPTMDESVAQ